jgi:hypothetical protein
MTKVLTLMASRRLRGNSHVLALEAAAGAESYGAEIEMLNLTELRIDTCEGCLRCVFKGKCSADDDMEMLLKKIIAADGLIVSCPVYLLSPAAVIKKLVDRALVIALYADELFNKRRGALTITSAGKEDWNPLGLEMLNQFALAYGFPIYNYLEAYAPGPAEILLQDRLLAETGNLGAGLVKYIQGEAEARIVEPNQCPSCYSRSFRFLGNLQVQCPICLVKGEIDSSGNITILSDITKDSFWEPGHRKSHLEEWVKATRGPYLENRPKIREKLKKYFI